MDTALLRTELSVAEWQERYERERRARLQAESLLQKVGTELFERNEQLQRYAADLAQHMDETQTIVDTAAEGIITISEDGTIYRFNRTAEKIFRSEGRRIVGHSLAELLPGLFENLENGHRQVRRTPCESGRLAVNVLEVEGRRLDGDRFPALVSLSAWQRGEQSMFTAIVRDDTLQQALEARLTLSQKREAVGRMAAGIAHEINSPIQYVAHNITFVEQSYQQLQSLMTAYEDLANVASQEPLMAPWVENVRGVMASIDYAYLSVEVPKALSDAHSGTQRITEIVQAVRRFSHPGSRQSESVDINEMISNVVAVARGEWNDVADVTLQLDSQHPRVQGYAAELSQAILNLIVNAVHAVRDSTVNGPVRGQIEVVSQSLDHEVEIRVRDTGVGIDPKNLGRIFDPFFTTKAMGDGTGQGLAICHTVIVDKHGGALEVETRPGEGSTFVVRIPCHPPDCNREGAPAP